MDKLSNSYNASKAVHVMRESERFDNDSIKGIYLGKTLVYKLPFFLNQESLLNPHIAILGMTGCGKTFLLRSIIGRSFTYHSRGSIVMDWNGEYSEIVNFLSGTECEIGNRGDLEKIGKKRNDGIVSFNLSKLRDKNEKERIAVDILGNAISEMRLRKLNGRLSKLVIIDEAWKLLKAQELALLFRESRKYGFGIIVATQLARDIINEIIANSACIIIFKLQNSTDFELLEKSGIINSEEVARITELPIGSCLVLQRYKENPNLINKIFIERIEGMDYSCYKFFGGAMRFEVVAEEFINQTNKLGADSEIKNAIINYAEQNERRIDLANFISFLFKSGFGRADIVRYLRSLKVDDISILKAYNSASRLIVDV